MIINTNIEALRASRNLSNSQTKLGKSLARLSSGDKINQPSDDAAGLAVSEKMRSQQGRLRAADTNIQNAISYVQTAEANMKSMSSILTRMSELAMLAQDVTKNSEDIALYGREFDALKDQLRATIGGNWGNGVVFSNPLGMFNGVPIYGQKDSPMMVTIGEKAGQTLTISSIDLAGTGTGSTTLSHAFARLLFDESGNASYNLSVAAGGTRGLMIEAIEQLATERAQLGAVQSRLDIASNQINVQLQTLAGAISRIRDVDVAQETTEYAKNQILVQSGTAMLAQANELPESVLRLLQ